MAKTRLLENLDGLVIEADRLALQDLRSWQEADEAGKKVGFKLHLSYDAGAASPVLHPWSSPCCQHVIGPFQEILIKLSSRLSEIVHLAMEVEKVFWGLLGWIRNQLEAQNFLSDSSV